MNVRPHGFTLLELMTAIAVLGILLAIGVPAFSNITRANQIAAESNNLLAALTIARSEAVKRGVRVSVCAAATAATCDAGVNWGNGWIVFEDDFGSAGVLDASDIPLQVAPRLASGVTIMGTASAVSFARTGRAELASSFDVTKSGCTGTQRRTLTVDLSGRVGLARVAC